MCTQGYICILIDTEYSHSAMIIEFFWFLVAFLSLIIGVVKCVKIHTVHDIPTYEQVDAKSQSPSIPSNDPQKDAMRNPPAKQDSDNINIEIEQNSNQPSLASSEQKQLPTDNTEASQGPLQSISSAIDLMVNKHLVIFVIFVYLINNFASFIFAIVLAFLSIIQLFLFNYLRIFEKLGNPTSQKYSELSYHIWIIALFLNYFIHDQSINNLA